MSNKHKKCFTTLNYIEYFLTLAFEVTESSAFASLLGVPIGIMSSSNKHFSAITAAIKNYKSIIKKKKKKHHKIVSLKVFNQLIY